MEMLKIGSRVCFDTLQDACKNGDIISLPISHDGEHMSYVNILLLKVNPLGEMGCSYFKGETILSDGEEPVRVDGATRMEHTSKDNHNYGYLAIY